MHGYSNRCKRYHFLPLEIRRNISDIVFLYKVANGFVDSPEILSMIKLCVPRSNLRPRQRLHVPASRTNYRKNSFITRTCKSFNMLPLDADLFCSSIATIKRTLTSEYFDKIWDTLTVLCSIFSLIFLMFFLSYFELVFCVCVTVSTYL